MSRRGRQRLFEIFDIHDANTPLDVVSAPSKREALKAVAGQRGGEIRTVNGEHVLVVPGTGLVARPK